MFSEHTSGLCVCKFLCWTKLKVKQLRGLLCSARNDDEVENKNRLRGAESGRACVLSGVYQEADTVWVTSFTLYRSESSGENSSRFQSTLPRGTR